MKNKIMISLIAASVITGSAFADMANVEGLTTTQIVCENGTQGFTVEIEREGVSEVVSYSSCEQGGFVSSGSTGGATEDVDPGEYVNLGPETEYSLYYPNGYTEPTVAADNTCAGGYDQFSIFEQLNCTELDIELGEGWLEFFMAHELWLTSSTMSSLENLANLVSARELTIGYNNNLTSLDGLENFQTSDHLLSVYYLDNVNDFSGLRNLTSVFNFDHNNNPLMTNLDHLSNLTTINGAAYITSNDALTDISGLSSVTDVGDYIYLDYKNYDVKLDANSWICTSSLDAIMIGEMQGNESNKHLFCN